MTTIKSLWSGEVSEAVAVRQRAFAAVLNSDGEPTIVNNDDNREDQDNESNVGSNGSVYNSRARG